MTCLISNLSFITFYACRYKFFHYILKIIFKQIYGTELLKKSWNIIPALIFNSVVYTVHVYPYFNDVIKY